MQVAPPVEVEQVGSDSEDEGGVDLPEFFILLWQPLGNSLRLPDRIAALLEGREPESLTLQLEGCHHHAEAVVFRQHGELFLGNGWAAFTRMHQLEQGRMLTFRCVGAGKLRIKMYDGTCLCHTCCTDGEAPHGEEGSDSKEEDSEEQDSDEE